MRCHMPADTKAFARSLFLPPLLSISLPFIQMHTHTRTHAHCPPNLYVLIPCRIDFVSLSLFPFSSLLHPTLPLLWIFLFCLTYFSCIYLCTSSLSLSRCLPPHPPSPLSVFRLRPGLHPRRRPALEEAISAEDVQKLFTLQRPGRARETSSIFKHRTFILTC
jgi:hypothetical protein